jgi:hypothetical protein
MRRMHTIAPTPLRLALRGVNMKNKWEDFPFAAGEAAAVQGYAMLVRCDVHAGDRKGLGGVGRSSPRVQPVLLGNDVVSILCKHPDEVALSHPILHAGGTTNTGSQADAFVSVTIAPPRLLDATTPSGTDTATCESVPPPLPSPTQQHSNLLTLSSMHSSMQFRTFMNGAHSSGSLQWVPSKQGEKSWCLPGDRSCSSSGGDGGGGLLQSRRLLAPDAVRGVESDASVLPMSPIETLATPFNGDGSSTPDGYSPPQVVASHHAAGDESAWASVQLSVSESHVSSLELGPPSLDLGNHSARSFLTCMRIVSPADGAAQVAQVRRPDILPPRGCPQRVAPPPAPLHRASTEFLTCTAPLTPSKAGATVDLDVHCLSSELSIAREYGVGEVLFEIGDSSDESRPQSPVASLPHPKPPTSVEEMLACAKGGTVRLSWDEPKGVAQSQVPGQGWEEEYTKEWDVHNSGNPPAHTGNAQSSPIRFSQSGDDGDVEASSTEGSSDDEHSMTTSSSTQLSARSSEERSCSVPSPLASSSESFAAIGSGVRGQESSRGSELGSSSDRGSGDLWGAGQTKLLTGPSLSVFLPLPPPAKELLRHR